MKRIALFLLIFCISVSLSAQKDKKPRKPKDNFTEELQPLPKRVVCGISLAPSCDWFAPLNSGYFREKAEIGARYGFTFDINLAKKARSANYYFTVGVMINHLQGVINFPENYTIFDSTVTFDNATRHYTSTSLVIPTGIKLKSNPMKNCVIGGQFGLYHSFLLSGKKYDSFVLDEKYNIVTDKVKNDEAGMLSETVYAGLGFEYVIVRKYRASLYVNYNCMFTNYFNKKSVTLEGNRKKSIVHGIEFVLGFAL